MKIAVTGTPGTGKTEVSKTLAKALGFTLVSANDFAYEKKLVDGFDKKRGSYIIDEKRLKAEFGKLKGSYIIEGHISHFCSVDLVIVLRTNPKELKSRLEKRGWKKEKIDENIDAEIAGVCLEESVQSNKNVIEIDTSSGNPQKISRLILDILGSKSFDKYRPGKIDWVAYI